MEKANSSQKLKEFFKKYNKLFFTAVITLLLFFANLCSPLWIVATVLTFVFYIFLNIGEIVAFSMYFNMFSGIETFYIASLLCGFAVIVVKYIIDLSKKRAKFYPLPFALTMIFVILFSLINYGYNSSGALQGALIISLLFVSYFLFVYRKQINVDESFKALMIGILVSAVLGLVSMIIPNFAHKIYHFDGTYKRLRLLCLHQNHLAIICLFAISYYVYKIANGKGKLWVNLVYCVVLFVIGLFTMSKAFIVVAVLIVLYLLVFAVKKYKLKSLKAIIPCLVVFVIICTCAHELVMKIINRFVAYNTTSSFINQITTGRSGIWYEYFSEISSSILKMLFGVGLFSKELVAIGPHNVLVYFMYRTGIVGLVLLAMLIWSYINSYDGKLALSFKNCLPLFVFIIIAMEEMIFSDRFFFFMVFAIILISNSKNEEESSKEVLETSEDFPQKNSNNNKK